MNNWIRFSGVLGLVLFFTGLIGGFLVYPFTGNFPDALSGTHLVIGILLLVLWFARAGVQGLGNAKASITGRTARFGAMATIYTVVFIGILVVLNVIASRHDKKWDLTSEHVYSLSVQSENIIKELKKSLKLVSFSESALGDGGQTKDLLDRYRDINPSMVSLELIDPRKQPQLVDKYGMKPGNLIYIQYGEGEENKGSSDKAKNSDEKKGVMRLNENSEEAITNAIIKLERGAAKKVYWVTGHGEASVKKEAQDFATAISNENLTLTEIFLGQSASVPDDAAAVLLVSPKKPLREEERKMLMDYADQGGRLILMTDPRTTSDVKDIAAHFDIEVGDNVVLDQVQRLFAGPAIGAQPVVRTYGNHAITRDMNDNTITVFNIASSVSSKGKTEGDKIFTELAKTGPTAWGETNLAGVFDQQEATAQLDDTDVKGPVTLAVAYENKIKTDSEKKEGEANFEKRTRVVVFGDSDWILGQNLSVYANRDLALNSLNWLIGEEGGISIRPKKMKTSGIKPLPRSAFVSMMQWSFLIPEVILILGLFVWWRRKTAA